MATGETFLKFLLIGPPSSGKTSLLRRFTDNDFQEKRTATLGCEFKMKVMPHAATLLPTTVAVVNRLRADMIRDQRQRGTPAAAAAAADGGASAVPSGAAASPRTAVSANGTQVAQTASTEAVPTITTSAELTAAVDRATRPMHVTMQLWDIAGQDRSRQLVQAFYRGAHGALVVCDVTREQSLAEAALWRETLTEIKIKIPKTRVDVPAFLLVNKIDLIEDRGRGLWPCYSPVELDKFCGERGFLGWAYTSAKTGENADTGMRRLVDLVADARLNVALSGDEEAQALQKRIFDNKRLKLEPKPQKRAPCRC